MISVIGTISLLIYTLSLLFIMLFCAKHEKWIDKIQVLERLLHENEILQQR